ncbi:peptide/nickel transport system substrate-binding protein [Antricoccus suffuscus]|uniref:Peptide/nickel transport system substrate-binding protein n=1 Tax=Antricoccus suffuscus TaxID=1629062 RepID=A0A2T1A1E4_9ACTN|nr:ABC transporter substrate-binding protein [Antricoccus suffuscus]PRZ42425.1 peptide/nickel transport system substrate-binding protein [Antricoccus suffuscus]
MRNKLTVAVVMAACLAFATACSSGGSSSTGKSERKAETSACPAYEKGTNDPSATFTWIYSVGNTSFDPDKITTNNSQMYLYPIYDSLVHIDAKGNPEPMLAKKWSIDGKSMTLELIPNWKYHDGTPFDAASVKANLDRHRAAGSWNEQALSDVTNVTVVDADTVKIDTANGAAPLVAVLASSAGMMMSPSVFDDPNQALTPTGGSGAFTLSGYTPGSKVEYTAVKNYWSPDDLRVAKMVYLVSGDDNARLNSVISGAADTTFLRASMYDPAKQAGLVVCEAPSLSSYQIALNTEKSEFSKKEVRQALNYAIDRKSLAAVTNGFCEPGGQMYPESYFASDPDLTADKYPYDPQKAKDLLKKAGLTNGFEFTMEVINLDLYQQLAEVIQANLQEVGVKMNIVPVEINKLADDFSVSKTADAQMSEQKAESDPSIQIESYYIKGGFNNPGNWSDPEITKLNEEGKAGATTDERAKTYKKLYKAAYDAVVPDIVLCHLTTPFTMNKKVMGVEIFADATRQFRGVAIKK